MLDNYGIPPALVWLVGALAVVGLGHTMFFAYSLLRAVFSIFVLPGISLSKFGPKGSWAVITGASDGLGKEFALQLSRKGFNVFLISRTASKLETLASEIKTQSPKCETKTYAMDFSENNSADYSKLKGHLQGLDVAILINNVGQSHDIPVPFVQTPEQELKDIVTINCLGTLRITQLVAPILVQRKRGLILTMASFGGFLPTPLLATYSGSKAFLQQWSTALGAELAPAGVTVHLVQSYLVVSAMSKIRRPSMMIPSARSFVKAALGKIGRSTGMAGVGYSGAPYWSHALMVWALRNIVGTTNTLVLGINKSMHEGIRKRALRKAEREGKKRQ